MGNQMFVCTPHGTIPFMFFFEATIPFYVQYNMFGLSNSCHQQNSKDSRILYMLVVESYAWTQHMIEKLMLLYG